MAHCFVTRQLPGNALERLKAAHDTDVWPGRFQPSPEELCSRAAQAEGLLTMLVDRVDAELLDGCPQLKAIANYAVGYDNIDVEAAMTRGIEVGNTPDVLTETTADLAFALLLAAARRLPEAIEVVRNGEWGTWEPGLYLGHEVHGSTLGIVGMGRIGKAVARRAEAFDMHVVGADARDRTAVHSLLGASDFVSLHCPLTPQTHHLIDAAALEHMREDSILVNTARGPIVDQVALRHALIEGTIGGAALDVTDPEPLPSDDPLMSAPNLIVVPHVGSATHTTRERMADLAVDNLLAALDGRPMPHAVTG
jgi:glyoxylate reductase